MELKHLIASARSFKAFFPLHSDWQHEWQWLSISIDIRGKSGEQNSSSPAVGLQPEREIIVLISSWDFGAVFAIGNLLYPD